MMKRLLTFLAALAFIPCALADYCGIIPAGSTDQTVYIRVLDATTGVPNASRAYNDSGIDLEYVRTGAAAVDITEATQTASGAHSDGGFVSVGHGNYRLDLPDAAVAAGVRQVQIQGTITGYIVVACSVDLTPSVNVTSYGGTAGTFSGGRPEVNVTHAAGTAWGSGAITAASIASDAITAAKIANDAIGATEIANSSIDAATFAAGAIDASAIAADAIGASELATDAIGAAEIAADAIGASELATGAITTAEFASGAINAAAIAADAIGASEVAADVSTELLTGLANLAVNVAQVSGDGTAADTLETWLDGTAGSAIPIGIVDQGTAQSATGTTLVLRSALAMGDDTAIGMTLVACGSTQGYCQARAVTDYVQSTDTATVETWTVTPSGTVTYYLFGTAPSSGGGSGLDAAGVRAAIGLSSANLDTQLAAIDDYVDTEVAAILDDTGTSGVVIVNDGITAAKIAADAIGASEIAADAIGASEIAADAIGSSELAANSITSSEVADGSIDAGALAADALTAAKIASDVTTELQSGLATASALSTVAGYLDTEVAAILADTNELQTDWANGGRLDLLLDGAASAGDPWTTTLPGAYSAGTAGYIVGNNLNATVSSRASQTSLDTVDDYLDTEVAAILDDTGTSGVVVSASSVRTAVGLASANLDTQIGDLPTNAELATSQASADDATLAAIAALNNLSAANVRDVVIEDQGGGVTLGCAISVVLAYAAGDLATSGANSTYEDPSGTETRITGNVASAGNRTASVTCPTY